MNSLPVETLAISAAIIRELDNPDKTKDEIFKNVAEANQTTIDRVVVISKSIIELYKERTRRLE